MKRCILLLLLLLFMLVFVGNLSAQEAYELIKAGDIAYLNRSETTDAVQKAIKKWEHASMVDPKDPSPVYKIAMAYCFLGRFSEKPEGAEKLFTKAYEYAKKAVEKDGKNAAAHYWCAYALDKSVEKKNKFAKLAVKGDITSHYVAARSIDPEYYFGGPDRGLASLFLKSPVPTLSLARKHIDESLSHGPDFSANLLLEAEVLLKEGRKQEAGARLKKILSLKPIPGFAKELADDQEKAKTLLDQIKQM